MKRFSAAALGMGLLIGTALAQDEKVAAQPASPLKDMKQKASYGIGLSIGRNMKSQSVDVDTDALARGIKDAVTGGKPLLTDQELKETMMAFQQELQGRQAGAAKAIGDKNKKEGAAFLAANAKKPGITTLKSGLQYKVVKEGTGPSPKATDEVKTNYRGTLIDGTEFDKGDGVGFPVNQVIAGWTEALQLMKVGSKWQLFIPAELAYGQNPQPGGEIGPNATLLFDIELLSIEKK